MALCPIQSFFPPLIYLDIMGLKFVKQIEGHSWEKLS